MHRLSQYVSRVVQHPDSVQPKPAFIWNKQCSGGRQNTVKAELLLHDPPREVSEKSCNWWIAVITVSSVRTSTGHNVQFLWWLITIIYMLRSAILCGTLYRRGVCVVCCVHIWRHNLNESYKLKLHIEIEKK